ncbi:MAG TPA: prephenate dehydratase domain-containing protein [Candidatus Saccharimonadales bacterium]|nr:prephenate dehydratase domain-containing protein [Candidatus Saccharimonadales bacterium]
MLKVAIQGAQGSFHELAAQRYFGKKVPIVYCDTFKAVFDAIHDNTASAAVVAIGNSHYGDIDQVYDRLIANNLNPKSKLKYWISGEVYINIEQCLLGVPGTTLKTITEVHSQAPALGQCFNFLHTRLSGVLHVEQDDTAKSALLVSQWQDPTKAAIASRTAAKLYNLKVIASAIQDHKVNITRFLIIETSAMHDLADSNKTSLLLKTSHQPGSLAKALVLFSDFDINLSYLQSVPIPHQPFQYRFYIDMEAGLEDKRVVKALKVLRLADYKIDVLGSYKKAKFPN